MKNKIEKFIVPFKCAKHFAINRALNGHASKPKISLQNTLGKSFGLANKQNGCRLV